MQVSAFNSIGMLRADQRRLSHGPAMPRLWHAMRDEWQRRLDRVAAQAVHALDHPGVSEDYRTASRGNRR